MAKRELDQKNLARDEDWYGNNAAFSCPLCGQVFVVSSFLREGGEEVPGKRSCPNCGNSIGTVTAGKKKGKKKSGGTAIIEWKRP